MPISAASFRKSASPSPSLLRGDESSTSEMDISCEATSGAGAEDGPMPGADAPGTRPNMFGAASTGSSSVLPRLPSPGTCPGRREEREELLDWGAEWATMGSLAPGPAFLGSRAPTEALALALALWGLGSEGDACEPAGGPPPPSGRTGETCCGRTLSSDTPGDASSSPPSSTRAAAVPLFGSEDLPEKHQLLMQKTMIKANRTTAQAATHFAKTCGVKPPLACSALWAATSFTAMGPVDAAPMPCTSLMLMASFRPKLADSLRREEDARSATALGSAGSTAPTLMEPACNCSSTSLGLTPPPT
mmetsp:Transcript_53102/g.154514  ORF Transcript_53102/g.154514 Transcript_53102/m.154514 type:complete len:304 (+) Transcript_53102:200-1111(+)